MSRQFVSMSLLGIGLFAALSFAGCMGEKPDADAEGAADKFTVAVIPKGNSHEFWQSVKAGTAQAAAELGDITVDFRGPAKENDPTEQKEMFELNLNKGVDGIAIAPVDGTAMGPTIDQAGAQNVPVVVFDSGTTATTFKSFIATDNYAAGEKAGKKMAALLGNTGKIVVLRYKAGSVSTEKREAGFIDAVKAAGLTIISADQEGAGREKEVSQTLLSRFGNEAQGIYTPNQSTTIGMIQALREGGYYAKGIVHVGFDNSPEILDSLQKDEIKAYVTQDPVSMGYLTVKALHAVLSGQTAEKTVDTGSALVTKEALTDAKIKSLVGLK